MHGSRWIGLAIVLAAAAVAVRAQTRATNDNTQVTGFTVPFYNDQGEMTGKLHGGFARIRPDGLVEISGMNLECYSGSATGRVADMTVTAPRCVYDRKREVAGSTGEVRIVRKDMVVTGQDFRWDNRHQALQISRDSRVVLRNARKTAPPGVKGVLP